MIKGGLKHLSRVSDVLFRKLRVERDITIFPDDVFLTSYPRSGNTWMRFLVGNLLHQEKPVTFLNMEGLVPDMYKQSDRTLRHMPRPRILKSHECFDPRYRRIIYIVRDPRDVVLSCYFQNIPLNATNVNFLSFERLAKHYADLMDIWLAVREWEGFAWMEVRYEDTVAALEKEGRRVTEFLGLTWDEGQARFYEKSRTKQLYSPTYQDVTRPVYSRSVARWRAYEKHLAPILPALEPYCRKFGYE